jgi:hypothetical protein
MYVKPTANLMVSENPLVYSMKKVTPTSTIIYKVLEVQSNATGRDNEGRNSNSA